jgi:hypothetical protein
MARRTQRPKSAARRGKPDLVSVKVPPGRMRLPDGTIASWPEETIRVPRDLAQEHQSTSELLAALQAGASISLADWHRFATCPPMTGNRLYTTVARLSQLIAAHHAEVSKALRQTREEMSARGKHAAEVRHGSPGKSRDKRAQMRAAWASGEYASREECAEKKHAAVGLSFSRARLALTNTPDPKRT